jgi:hypothetical protein
VCGPRIGLALGGLVLLAGLVAAVVVTGFGRQAAAMHLGRLGDRLRSIRPQDLREALAGS